MSFETLKHKISAYDADADFSTLKDAYKLAEEAHKGQVRSSGEDFIIHPLSVANILAGLEMDTTTIIAGILHDVVEDSEFTINVIEAKFGKEVALLVDGVTKLGRIEFKSKEEQQVENLRKMFIAMAKDIRVILIKLADRLHNMRTLKHLSPRKQKEIAEETVDIFAPLAHRLGIFKVKWELEDLALRYLEPERYYELVDKIAIKRAEREEYVTQLVIALEEKLKTVGIKAQIKGRPKNFYSIYKKMVKQSKDISEIYDLIAVRVIVDSVKDCYGTLGMIHSLWKPIPGRFKDYIAMPKSNMYQSLHTTVIGPHGEPFEIQIRTWEMHRTAEFGIAAHWRYKEGEKGEKGERGNKHFDQKLAWLRQLLEWQTDLRDAHEFMESLKIDMFADSVFVFSPKGDVIELPAESTPVDFAYRVHTAVGNSCVGAKINGKIVPIDYKLENGDIIEILTSKQANGPSRDWLNFVQTSQAKSRIKNWFKREKREDHLIKGRDIYEKEVKKQNLETTDFIKNERLAEISKRWNFLTIDDLFVAIGDGVITPNQVIVRIKEDFLKNEKKPLKESTIEELAKVQAELKPWRGGGKANQGIMVKGIDNLLVRLSRCCSPMPGDPIVGYITRGRGVSIHRADCINVLQHSTEEEERMIEVTWDSTYKSTYQVKIEVYSMDRSGLLTDVMSILTEMKISANSVHARGTKNRMATVELILELNNLEQLTFIISKIKSIKDIFDVRRVSIPGSDT